MELGQEIDRVMEETGFSGVVHVARAGETLYERAAGLADRAHGIPNTMDTRFAIASGAKGFTALAVMALVADGAVTLDTSARSLLGDGLDLIDPAVTVGQLLAHTSGIGEYLPEDGDIDDYILEVPGHRLATPEEFRVLLGGHQMRSAPGARFEYCNGGYVLLAIIIEAAGATAYHDFVLERVCRPAGMAGTDFLRLDELPGDAAIGYIETEDASGGRRWRTNHLHLPVRGLGDGGAYSSVADLARFWPALLEGRIVPSALVGEMVRAHNDAPSNAMRYGLGFWLRTDRDTVLLEGYDAGVSFRSAYDPASTFHYTVIANTAPGAWPVVRLLDERLPDLAS